MYRRSLFFSLASALSVITSFMGICLETDSKQTVAKVTYSYLAQSVENVTAAYNALEQIGAIQNYKF